MKTRTSERVQRIRVPVLAFALVFLACMDAMGSDVERQIPVIRNAAGSGVSIETSREGTRQTATPFLTLYNPTLQEIEDRICRVVKLTDRSAAKGIRTSRKVKPAPAAVAAVPELRLGRTHTSPLGTD
jgi:hypothetical protein